MRKKAFRDEKGRIFYIGYIKGSTVDNKYTGLWFVVAIKNNKFRIYPNDDMKVPKEVIDRFTQSMIKDCIYNGEILLSEPNDDARRIFLR